MTLSNRPTPETLLEKIQEKKTTHGKLKIFFGACAGSGKTYAMLSSAQEELREKKDVIIGIVETHQRLDTIKLTSGIPILPLLEKQYHGIVIKEFDLDAALQRRPDIILVDELAHTNIEGARHPKRWMDVKELLDAGINVFTTLNVQHIESLNDIVENIAGVRIKETVPDSIFDNADEIVLVDVPSEVILERLHEGKVYLGEFIKHRAAQHFFKIENLIALREMALRRTAERVDAERDLYHKLQYKNTIKDNILVCVGPYLSSKLIRIGKQQSIKLKASWTVLHVENAKSALMPSDFLNNINSALKMAEQLGATVKRIQSDNVPQSICDFVEKNSFNKIILGKPSQSRWKRFFQKNTIDYIIQKCHVDDISIINDDKTSATQKHAPTQKESYSFFQLGFGISILLIGGATFLGYLLKNIIPTESMALIYIVIIVICASKYNQKIAVFISLMCTILYQFVFAKSLQGFSATPDIITTFLLLCTGLFISVKTTSMRQLNILNQQREEQNHQLFSLSHKLLSSAGHTKIAHVLSEHLSEVFDCAIIVWMYEEQAGLKLVSHPQAPLSEKENSVAHWVFSNNAPAGIGTDTMPSARGFYVPISNAEKALGVIGLIPKEPHKIFSEEEVFMVTSFATQAALALERRKF